MAGGSRSGAREVVAAQIAAGGTVASAAADASVSARTVHRWLSEPSFVELVGRLRAEAIGRTTRALAAASTRAARTLVELLEASAEGVRLQAARSVVELALRLREAEELERR